MAVSETSLAESSLLKLSEPVGWILDVSIQNGYKKNVSFSPEAEFVDVYVCAFKSASALLVSVEDVVVMDFGQKLMYQVT